MNRTSLSLAVALSIALVSSASGQSVVTGGSAQGSATSAAETKGVQSTTTTNAEASAATNADARATMETIKAKGSKVSADARAKTEAKLEASAKSVDQQASAKGDARVAGRLATEFGMTADQLIAEKNDLQTSWGQLMIAHSLAANSTTNLTAAQLIEMRGDSGWGQIAAGLGLNLGETVSAVRAESRVANGLANADGKVAAIHGEGARAGLGVNAGVGAGAASHGANAAANAGVGVGIKIKP